MTKKLPYVVRVKVYDDGDTELTKHEKERLPERLWDARFFDEEEALIAELITYGHEEPRITEALKELETIGGEVII